MSRLFAAVLVGLTIVATVSTSASAFHCVATSTNGKAGWADRITLVRARAVAIRACIIAGGNLGGHYCRITFCQ